MQLSRTIRLSKKARGFTMVELALCIAIVAIAMVALIGIMPTGLTIQQQNREEALIAREAQYLFDAIRGGNTSLDTLTNYVDSIILARAYNGASNYVYYSGYHDPKFDISGPSDITRDGLTSGARILGLATRLKYESIPTGRISNKLPITNSVFMFMRPASGPVPERPYLSQNGFVTPTNNVRDLSFRYLARVELSQVVQAPGQNNNEMTDIRITFQWPVVFLPVLDPATGFPKYRVGPNSETFRAQAFGIPVQMTGTNLTAADVSSVFSTNSVNYPIYLYRFLPGTL